MDESTPTRRIELLRRTPSAIAYWSAKPGGGSGLPRPQTVAKKSLGLVTGALDEAHDADSPGSMRADILTAPRCRNCRPREGGFTAICDCRRNVIPSAAVGYRIASLFPGAAAFLTSLSSRMPLSYVASHADSSSSTGSVKLR